MKKSILIYLILIFNMLFSSNLLKADWEPVNNGIDRNPVSIHFIKQYNDTLFSSPTTISFDPYGLYKSTDFGKNWEFIGLSNDYVKNVVKFGNNLFACTSYNGIFYSSDDGKNWETRNDGLKDRSNNPEKKYISVNGIVKIGDTLFCASMKLYFSTNFGKTWCEINVGPNRTVEDIYEVNGQLFILAWQYSPNYERYVLHSSDRGGSWARTNLHIDLTKNNEFIFLRNNLFSCNSSDTLYISDNDGVSWSQKLMAAPIISISSTSDTLFALTENGVLYFSTDLGNSFNIKNANQIPFGNSINSAIITDKIIGINNKSDELFLLSERDGKWEMSPTNIQVVGEVRSINRFTDKLIINSKTGIYTSSNFWNAWNKINNIPNPEIFKIDTLQNNIIVIHPKSFSVSSDGGNSWVETKIDIPGTISSIKFYSDIYLCSTLDTGVYYSTDNGKKWSNFNVYKYVSEFNDVFIHDNPFPFNKQYYSVSKNYGLFTSGDSGKNWGYTPGLNFSRNEGWEEYGTKINGFTLVENKDLVFEAKVSTIFLNMQYRSIEPPSDIEYFLVRLNIKNYNWENLSFNFKPYLNLLDPLVKIKGIKDKLFAFPVSGGVFYSPDLGDTWIDKSAGAEYVNVFDIQDLGDYLFISTTNGVFREKMSEFEVSVTDDNQKSIDVYPNPASDYIFVRNMRAYSLQSIEIFDIFGKSIVSVETIHELSLPRIDVSALLPGVYFLRLGNEKPRKFIKI